MQYTGSFEAKIYHVASAQDLLSTLDKTVVINQCNGSLFEKYETRRQKWGNGFDLCELCCAPGRIFQYGSTYNFLILSILIPLATLILVIFWPNAWWLFTVTLPLIVLAFYHCKHTIMRIYPVSDTFVIYLNPYGQRSSSILSNPTPMDNSSAANSSHWYISAPRENWTRVS